MRESDFPFQLSLVDGDVLTVRGRIRDLLQVMVDGVMINKPILDVPGLRNDFGTWTML